MLGQPCNPSRLTERSPSIEGLLGPHGKKKTLPPKEQDPEVSSLLAYPVATGVSLMCCFPPEVKDIGEICIGLDPSKEKIKVSSRGLTCLYSELDSERGL